MNVADDTIRNLTDSLSSKGINVSREWLRQSIEYVADQIGHVHDNTRLMEKIYELFLDSDLHECYDTEKIPKNVQVCLVGLLIWCITVMNSGFE